MKKSKIKLTKDQTIIFDSEGGFITDGNFMMHKDYAELSDVGLQSFIHVNKSFRVMAYGTSDPMTDAPKTKQLLPDNLKNHYELEPSKILISVSNKIQGMILYNLASPEKFTCLNSTFLKYFQDIQKQNNLTVRFYQKEPLGPVAVTCGPDIIGLIMPIHLRYDHDLFTIMNAYAESLYPEKEEN